MIRGEINLGAMIGLKVNQIKAILLGTRVKSGTTKSVMAVLLTRNADELKWKVPQATKFGEASSTHYVLERAPASQTSALAETENAKLVGLDSDES